MTRCQSVLAASLIAVSAITVGAFKNDEYGFQAAIPAGFPECVGDAGGHVHGVGTVLGGKDCENPTRGPAFNVWADYNTVFYPNALDMLRDEECSGTRLQWAADEWKNAIAGLRTAVCRVDRPNGDVVLTLGAQRGKWKDASENAPYLNYRVNFRSTRARVEQDMRVFRRFVRSIKLVKIES